MHSAARRPALTPRTAAGWQLASGLVILLLASAGLRAEPVTLETEAGITARADYRSGQAERPAVLILHGMLQTHGVRPVRGLADALDAQGYPVLAPTLTLGIDRRQKSLDCEAIHNHTMTQDLQEIRRWVSWLAARRPGPIALVGHSTGGLKLLAYLQEEPHPHISRLVAASLAGFTSWTPGMDASAQIRKARSLGEEELHRFSLGYCTESYNSPPRPFLSYMRWREKRILQAVGESPVPVTVVLGAQDRRLPSRWLARLEAKGARVEILPGAGHFFEGLHEMDLADTVRDALGAGAR